MPRSLLLLILIPLVVIVLVTIEGRRQRKKYPDAKGRGGSVAGAGMLELQNLLQPDRKVEIVQRQQKHEEVREEERDEEGET